MNHKQLMNCGIITVERSLRHYQLTDGRQLRSQLFKLRTLEAFLLTLKNTKIKISRVPPQLRERALSIAARRHEDCRCGQGNKLQCPYCETPKTALQGGQLIVLAVVDHV